MPNSVPTHRSSPALFDVTASAPAHVTGRLERIALERGIAPLSVECDRITVITDHADALDHVVADIVAALRGTGRGRM